MLEICRLSAPAETLFLGEVVLFGLLLPSAARRSGIVALPQPRVQLVSPGRLNHD